MLRINSQISWTALLAISAVSATPVCAQAHSQPRAEISANVGALTGGTKFMETETLTTNAETATITAHHGVKTAIGFNAGGAVRVVPSFWVGVQYAMADTKPSASI